ncbi:hypothetical protein PTSG_04272 [Salpingoeca rosetta]|uniref:PH domain-containing protein n=1 Tax=Salpingoeca rosetta (strain ATCC 50818 / BSB-021) TaxID=946362 RepID=F2U735_SALR5|nr:uncharacterized protein PTSG_04272 [Salpingoeca rosetta]EGD83667.1 hypothetical protein PTSG_04272 [Salpingoeca rosetta]|eukprot:XP_004995171.1 hypothetical protein PTSG_04272 [Salpingoeca rosetta]
MSGKDDDLFFVTNVQKAGILFKRPFLHVSGKWQRRFFVLKDGFMLYYAEKEAKTFAETGNFNIHPKGVIPLGGCLVNHTTETDKPYAISINHPDFGESNVIVATDTEESLKDWIDKIKECTRITYKNAQVGETMIKCLKAKSEVIEEQRKENQEKLEAETLALQEERELREQIEEQLRQLQAEKEAKEQEAMQLKEREAEQRQSVGRRPYWLWCTCR